MAIRLPAPLRPLWPLAKTAYTRGTRVAAPLTGQLSRLRGGRLPRRSVPLVDASVAASGGRMWPARHEEHLDRAVPPGEPPRHPVFVRESHEVSPRVVVAELPYGRVLGPHHAVIDGDGAMIEEFSPYFGTARWREHPIFWHPFAEEPLEVTGSLGVLATRGDHSNYHFLLDVLPRLALLETPGVPEPERWYVPRGRAFQREILELAGFPPNAEVIDSDQAMHVRAESLLVPGLPDAHLRTPPWTVDFVRERLLPPDLERVPGRRIYVTRGRERHNRIVANEESVVEMLAERGFTVIDPGAMPMTEQIRTFAEAEWIVAPHGAALANLAFASPGASVIELFAPDYVQGCYWKLADCVQGLGYRYLLGVGRGPRNGRMDGVMSDITIDLPALGRALDSLPVELPPAAARAHS
jgi:capsular polysaccharide biosynthesis protein